MRVAALLLCSVFLINVHNGYGQEPVINWQRIYGGPYGDYAHSIRPTSDGGYIVAGYTEGNGGVVAGHHGNKAINDIWVVKINGTGDLEWQRCLGGTYTETGADVRQTPDGGYLVAGSSSSIECEIYGNKGALDYWVVKLSPKGDMIWQKHYGGNNHEYCYGLDLTSDGGFVVAGHTESTNGDVTGLHGKRDFWVVKADANGNMIWQKTAGGSEDDEAMCVRATPDGGCVVAGSTQSNDGDVTGLHGKNDMWVIKLSNGGNIEWQKALGGSDMDLAWGITLASDGGYIAAGSAASSDGDVTGRRSPVASPDVWVVKLGTTGALQWQKCYGGDYNDRAYDISSTTDGGYVVGGVAESINGDVTCNAGSQDMWVIKITSTGTLVWQKSMGGSIFDDVYSVVGLSDGSVIAAGISCSPNVYAQTPQTDPFSTCADFWVIKLNPPAIEPPPVVTISPSPGIICANRPTVFTASFQYAGTNPLFQWTRNGTPVGTNSHIFTGSGLANNDVIACRVTSGGACYSGSQQGTGSVIVKMNSMVAPPKLTVTPSSTTICGCDVLTFNASVQGGGTAPAYVWKVNGVYTGVNSPTFISGSLKAGDQVTCHYADASICMQSDTIYYGISLTGGSAQVPAVTIQASSNPVCRGSLVTFTATPSNAGINPSYQWKVNGGNVGTNAATFSSSALTTGDVVTCSIVKDPVFSCVSTPNATSNSITMTISQSIDPKITIATPASTICIGTSITFTSNVVNAGNNPTYEWKLNGLHVGGNTKTLTTNAIADGDIVSCDIIVDPGFACTSTDRASSNSIAMTVIMRIPPSASVTATGNDVCAGNNVSFTVSVQNGGANPSYQWMVNGTPVNNTSTSFNSSALSNGDKVYCMISSGAGGCAAGAVSSDTVLAIIHPLPQISISPADTTIKAGDQVQLRTIANHVATFEWSQPGKLQDPTVLSPRTVPLTQNTTYTLSAKSDMGCEASAIAVVRVGRPLAMPNAFTPNNDGANDIFRIPPAVLLDLKEFSIFDRWGNRIFTTKDVTKGWDGTLKGQQLNAGVYVYMISGNTEQGKVTVKGTVNLVR